MRVEVSSFQNAHYKTIKLKERVNKTVWESIKHTIHIDVVRCAGAEKKRRNSINACIYIDTSGFQG